MQADYIDHMGDDLMVVNAARVSFNKESNYVEKERLNGLRYTMMDPADVRLINYLSKNGHWTPFSHPMISIRETVPIFVARQRFKHMVGFTYNEVSRRYVDDRPEFYHPDVWRSRPDASIKQGSGTNKITHLTSGDGSCFIEEEYSDLMADCQTMYDRMLESGVAPEQARMVLPQSMFTSYYVTGSLAAWARAYKQRSDPHAQQEIQDLAKQWDDIIQPLFPVSWEALTS